MRKLILKRAISIIIAFIFLFEMTYSYAPVKCKASYVAGSMGIRVNTKGILQVGEESLIFIYRGNSCEIPYKNIEQIQYSKKKKSINIGSLKSDVPGISFRSYHQVPLEPRGTLIIAVITLVIAVGGLIVALLQISKRVYLNVVYESEGKTNWATFKIKNEDFQKILLTLSSKSGIDIQEI